MSEPRDILEALFVGDDVEDADLVRAARAAGSDDEVRALFDELALVDREVGGELEARVGEAWFLDSLDAMLAEEESRGDGQPDNVVSLNSRRNRFAPLVLAAAAALALGFGAIALQELQPEPQFQPRSAARVDQPDYQMPSVEVFCVERTADGVKFVGDEGTELATVRCSVDQEIKLAVRNPDPQLRHAAFFGVADDNSLYWYGPSPAAPRAMSVENTAELTPIGETIRLDVNHEPGTVRLIGVFAERPLEFSELQKWTAANMHDLRDGDVDVERGVMVRQTFEVTQ